MHHRHNTDGCSICYRFVMHLTTASTTYIILSALCDSPSALRNRLKPSVCLIIRWSISYTCYMLLDTCLLPSYWSMLHALHDINRHGTVYMLSRMYVLRVMWMYVLRVMLSMYDMLRFRYMIHSTLVNQCMLLIYACYRCNIHTVHTIDYTVCYVCYRSLIHVMHCWCILRRISIM